MIYFILPAHREPCGSVTSKARLLSAHAAGLMLAWSNSRVSSCVFECDDKYRSELMNEFQSVQATYQDTFWHFSTT